MKYKSIKNHLKPYSIHEKRKTTINHAFASAIAPVSAYSDQYVASAMVFLGQNPNDKLQCVYCGEEAETWDHLVGLVEEGSFRGFGHQIGNLVPCCKKCNSTKGNNKFEDFVSSHERIKGDRHVLLERLKNYLKEFTVPVNIEESEQNYYAEWEAYRKIKEKVVALMKEADEIAKIIRPPVITHEQYPSEVVLKEPMKGNLYRKNISYSFRPNDLEQFKKELVRTSRAHIRIHFSDGRKETKPWNASNFTESSDLMHNINSKTWFRRNYVEKYGVVAAEFSIEPFDRL